MKKFITLILGTLIMSFSSFAQGGTVGKPGGSNDTVTAAGSYVMALSNTSGTAIADRSEMIVDFTLVKIDSISGAYAKLQARLSDGTFHDIGTLPTDSTSVSFTNTTGAKGYSLRAPAALGQLGYDDWRVLLVVPTTQKFAITGKWKTLK